MHPHEGIFSAFVEGQASASERQEVEAHLKGCSDCRELLSFMRDFSDTAKDLADGEIARDEPHPQNSVIIAYEEGSLDKETSLHLRSHMLFCDRCAETYYLLKRMRAPSWTEVVIEAARSAKEFVLKLVEITGMGELVPLGATGVTRSDEPEEPQPKIEIRQHITDSGDEADLMLIVEPNSDDSGDTVRILVGIDPPKADWKVKLLDARGNAMASVSLSETKQMLHPGITPGNFVAQVTKDDEVLAECRVQLRSSDDRTPS
jgi:hypothetical protein